MNKFQDFITALQGLETSAKNGSYQKVENDLNGLITELKDELKKVKRLNKASKDLFTSSVEEENED